MSGSRFEAAGGRLTVVDALDPGQHDRLREWVGVIAAVERAEFGDLEAAWTFDDTLAAAANQQDHRTTALAAVLAGRVVGAAEVRMHLRDNTHRLDVSLMVHPDSRRLGVGSALLTEVERMARAAGRTVVGGESQAATSATGEALPSQERTSAFAARHGYSAANVELRSVLDVDGSPLLARLAGLDREVAQHATGYVVETVVGELPGSWLADQADLERTLSIDIPMGEVVVEPEVWDAERAGRAVAFDLATGRLRVQSVARYLGTGRIVAYTVLLGPSAGSTTAFQEGTLVARGHRGHRLGLAVKLACLRRLLAERPDVRRVSTWNAEDNAAMLRVNRALGYQLVGRMTEWQRSLP